MSNGPPAAPVVLHASSVAFGGRGVLLIGASGTGKSALALDLLSRGAGLVADDRTLVSLRDGVPVAAAPAAIKGQIEARGIGILAAKYAGPVPVVLVVDLDKPSTARLPGRQQRLVLGVATELILAAGLPNPAAAIVQYLKGGRVA